MAQTVVGIFDSASDAQTALQQLLEDGFSRNNVDISTREISDADRQNSTYADNDDDSKGGIGGFFASLFGTDDDDDNRRRRDNFTTVGTRHSIVTVHAVDADEAERAADILDDAGAIDVDERAEQYRSGSYNTTAGLTDQTNVTTTDRLTSDADQTFKVVEENLEVGKRDTERGGVRVRSHIVERPVEESVRLREERVRVMRNPVNRPATAADLDTFREGQIEMVEHAEVPVVQKTANVVEEISIGKEVTEREETIRDTVRRTDVEVEEINPTDTTYRTTDRDVKTDRDRDML